MRTLHGKLKRLKNENVIKKTLLPPPLPQHTHTVNPNDCKVIKKGHPIPTPPISISTPRFQGYLPLAKFLVLPPQVTQGY